MELIIFIGIQGTGKSTFYKNNLVDSHIRINLDMLKTRNREKILYNSCIDSKSKVVIDNTNPLIEDRRKYIDLARKNKYKVIGYYFESNVERSMERNRKRKGSVPDIAIKATKSKMQLPTLNEGFDEIKFIKINDSGFKVEEFKNEI